jgi:hypothetical protein
MMRKLWIPIAGALVVVAGGPAYAQDLQVKQNNDNVTKVDTTVGDTTVRSITNPAQSKVRVDDPTLGRIDVRIKPGDATITPPLTNVEVDARRLNDNVTKVDATADGITAKGITNPAQTTVKGRAEDGSKLDVRIKPPKN